MIRLERRAAPSTLVGVLTPVVALAATLLFGFLLFVWLGKDPMAGLRVFFVTPLQNARGWSEVGLKMTPLLLCALGLSLCYRANVWNIGAEGQLVAGGIAAGAVALLVGPGGWLGPVAGWSPGARAVAGSTGWLVVLAAGIAGGLAWAALTAVLRARFHANEILTSLMLTYVAQLLLLYVVHGPLKDPKGFNFPYSRTFDAVVAVPRLFPPNRVTVGLVAAVVLAGLVWLVLFRLRLGFGLQVAGAAPRAARYAGIAPTQAVWVSLLACGALAGLAGALEVGGPIAQLTPSISPGYGFAAIIVAWLGRLHPAGCVLAAFVMALIYIGGEFSQSRLGLPNAITGVLQGALLLSLLCADTFIHYRLRLVRWTPSPR